MRIKWFVKEAVRQRGLKLYEDSPVEKILSSLKLAKGKKLTNTALLLFSKEPWFLQSEIKCIRFSGDEPIKPYIDFESIEGSVFDLVEEGINFVMKNIKKAIWVASGKIQREEKYEYPLESIREAIVNAVAHRNYETTSKVQIRIFDSRIEIWSPGLLPEGIKIEDLKREHRSIPRNPLLFRQLFWVKYVEDVGGGTLDMIEQCKEWGIPGPEFKFITGAFVVFFRQPPALEDLEKLGLNKRQVRAMDYVVKKGAVSNKEYISLNDVSRKTATIDLTQLVTKGLLLKVGEGKRNMRYTLPNYAKITQKTTQNKNQRC